jgi:FAD/FMN-containing dehydrogenase
MGRSYGDSCLNADGHLLLTKWLNRWYLFDDITGRIRVESGVTIEDILRLCVPRGWFLAVTPGTKFVTVGGAIANDVHGKNHHREGSFGNHIIQLELLRSDGTRILCSPTRNPDWFHATVGGLGLTGMILWAEFDLKPISSPYMIVETVRFHNLNEFFSISNQSVRDFEYTVSWVDCLTRSSSIGRGFLIRANHASKSPSAPHLTKKALSITFPFDAPEFFLSNKTVAAFNSIFFRRHPSSKRQELVHYDSFYYPLDRINRWNRMYGKRGLVQWQCVVPLCGSQHAIKCSRSRAEGDKSTVSENRRERQEGQPFGGNDQESTWRVFLYWFPPFTRPTLRQIAHLPEQPFLRLACRTLVIHAPRLYTHGATQP